MKKHLLYTGCLLILCACSKPKINYDRAFSNIVMSTCSNRELFVGTTNCDCVVDMVTQGLPEKYRIKFAKMMYNGTLASTDIMHSFNKIVDRAMIRCASVPQSFYDDIADDENIDDIDDRKDSPLSESEAEFDADVGSEATMETETLSGE